MITVTKGQWFPITISNIQYGGADFDLQGATDVKAALISSLGTRAELSFEVTAYNELSAVSDGNLQAGKYSVEVTAVGSDGKNYRMRSPMTVIEITGSTTPSTASKTRVEGDNWELTADVEMHEAAAKTYMSLLEEARKATVEATSNAVTATDKANAAAAGVQKAVEEAENVNAELSGTKISVTNRNGETKTLELVDVDEHVTVTVKSEVEAIKVSGLKISVYLNHSTTAEAYTTDTDGKAAFTVTRGTYYEVHYPDMSVAKPISPARYTATLPTRSLTATYVSAVGATEHVTVSVFKASPKSQDAFGGASFIIQIGESDEKTVATGTDGTAQFDIPIGMHYKVTFPKTDGYYVFSSYSFEYDAKSSERAVKFYYYTYKTGVYIVTLDGGEYTLDEFKELNIDKSNAKLIAVYDSMLLTKGYIIYASVDDLHSDSLPSMQWCGSRELFNDIPSDGSVEDSQYYYDGKKASDVILSEAAQRGLNAPAFNYVKSREIVIDNKTMTGYIPSVGQFAVFYSNINAISNIVTYLTGNGVSRGFINAWKWASAQNGGTDAWLFTLNTVSRNKTGSYFIACFYAY